MLILQKKVFFLTHYILLLCSINISICSAESNTKTLYSDIKLQANEEISIPISDTLVNSKNVFLGFSARINSQNRYHSGSATALLVTVNNVPVTIDRLKNKRKYFIHQGVNKVQWFGYGEKSAWSVSYTPWDKADTVPGGEVHNFIFDIKNLLKNKHNNIILNSTLTTMPKAFIEIKDVALLTNSNFARSPLLTDDQIISQSRGLERFRELALGYHDGVNRKLNTDTDYIPNVVKTVAPKKRFSQNYELTVDKNGQLQVEVKGEKYNFSSYFRTPGGTWRSLGKQDSEESWSKYSVSNEKIICENNKLVLTRTISKTDSHIIIRDTFENKTTGDLPVAIMNTLDFHKLNELTEFRVAGVKKPRFYCNTSQLNSRAFRVTPLAYIEKQKSGMGILIQDDVYRNQASYLAWGSTLGIGDDFFYLAPKSKYTMVWKIFPIQEKDYYQFVNAIRSDWGFSREIPGLFATVHPHNLKKFHLYEDAQYRTPQAIKLFLESSGVEIGASMGMIPNESKLGKLEHLTGNEELKFIRKGSKYLWQWRDKAKKAGCEVKALPYLDVHLVRPYFDKGLENIDKRLPDSLIKDAYGEFLTYSTGQQYLVVPRLDNGCGKHLMKVLELLLDEQKFDGLFLDEWDHSRARISFNHFDGYSALIGKDAKLVRKIGFVPLLTREFQKAFIGEISKRGKIAVANQFDATMSSAKLPVIHLAEPLGLDNYGGYKIFAAQLTATPLSLHVQRSKYIWPDVKGLLKHGVLMCNYFKFFYGDHILKKCYPITVKEVWPGYVVGEKKIVTMSSGRYSFDRDKALTAFIYSGLEAQLCDTMTSVQQPDGKHEISFKLNSDQVVVIIEK